LLTAGNQDLVPDISPNGRRVYLSAVYSAQCGDIGKVNIWIVQSDGSHARPLTACDGRKCLGSFDPAFSPDGRSIAFVQDRLDAHGVNFNGVFIMRTDGTDLRRITSNGPDALPDGQPHFSPDGRTWSFSARNRPAPN
jgi:Tol biopolymer transport system component